MVMSQFVVPMLESEKGWGSKIDGHAGPFDSKIEAETFRDAYNAKWNQEKQVPDWYIVAQDPVPYKGQKCDYSTNLKS
jgi:hypothetical protein